jgi:AraC-like DNA-binding protein
MSTFRIERYWHVFLEEFGVSTERLTRRAGLPINIFATDPVMVDLESWALLWKAFDAEVNQPDLALQLGQSVTLDMFDPALFAALCSENLNEATARLQRYKRLMGPCRLKIEKDQGLMLSCHVEGLPLPPQLWGMAELVVWVALARHLTLHHIVPQRITMPIELEAPEAFADYFGIAVTSGPRYEVVFEPEDAQRRFLTTDASMWSFFEPALEHRLAECNARTTMRERVCAALFELLPSGRSELGDVARALGASRRTVQRRLESEGSTYREVLDTTRAHLAKHYLTRSQLTTAEIAFLLGYDDPNSLYPAFRTWTGTTPQAVRDAKTERLNIQVET